MDIGLKIKQLRMKMDLTQEELANRCELSKGFISQVERNLTSPSIATLIDILESLGTDLKDFFNENEDKKIVFRKEDIFEQENTELGHNIKWIVPNAQKNKMEPIFITIRKNGKTDVYYPHECEVFGYVIQGTVDLYIHNKKHKVKKGECFYYSANAEYYLQNNYSQDASLIWVSSPPTF